MSYRDVEELLSERGIGVSHETVRRWALKFGTEHAKHIKKRRPLPHTEWFLDEVFVRIDGKPMYLWRAVDGEGEVLETIVTQKRDKKEALKLLQSSYRLLMISP